jgi:hypothetical protein
VASRSDIEAGKAHVSLYVKGLAGVQAAMRQVATVVAAVGAALAAAGAAILAIKSFIDAGSALNDLSARTQVSADKLSILKYAAEQTGASVEDLEAGLRNMVRRGYNPNDFHSIAKSIMAIEDPVQRAQKVLEIFGRSGLKLLPMMADLAELSERAKQLGIVVDPADVALADELGDRLDDMRATWKMIVFQVGAALAPTLLEILKIVQPIATAVVQWVDENRQLVVIIAGLAAGLVVVGTAALAFAATLAGVLAVVGLITGLIAGGWTTVIVAGVVAMAGVVASAIATVAALTAAWMTFSNEGRFYLMAFRAAWGSLVDYMWGRWSPLIDDIKSSFKGISDALSASQIGLAFTILIQGMTVTWKEFIAMQMRDIASIAPMLGIPSVIADFAVGFADKDLEDAKKLLNALKAGAATAAANAPKPGGDLSMGRSALIGFNARAAMLSANIIGPGAAGDPVVGAVEHAEGEIVKAIRELKGLGVTFT